MSDISIAFKTNTYAMILADGTVAHSIILVKSTEDKIVMLDSHKLLACTGEIGKISYCCMMCRRRIRIL